MRTQQLGSTGLEITRIGFGAWAIGGGDWFAGWGAQDDEDSVAAIRRAVELGVNWIDTAAVYGFGRSEEMVGRAIRDLPKRPYIFTKGSRLEGADRMPYGCLKRDSLRRELEGSLTRLGVDAVDLYQIHWPLPDEDVEEGWSALVQFKEEGLARHVGVSNFSVDQLRRCLAIGQVETLQPQYSLVAREAEEELLPFCEENGIGVIVYSPMGSGLLTGAMTRERIESLPENDWRSRHDRFKEPALTHNLELVERLRAVAERRGVAPGAVAIAWTLRNAAVDAAITGFRRPDQVDPLLAGADLDLTDAEAAEIEGAAQQPVGRTAVLLPEDP